MKISELQIQRNTQNIKPLQQVKNPQNSSFKIEKDQNNLPDFSKILDSKLNPENSIRFSAHAKRRIADRNIPVDLTRLENGINQVQKKGAANSLVLIDNNAYIVSVKNKTIVTAVDQQSLKNNVFTNIDSVAIV
jgi:flagellar operon protein